MHNNIASQTAFLYTFASFLIYMKCWVREAELKKNVDDKETDLSFPGRFSFMTALTYA